MKQILMLVFLTVFLAPSARAEILHYCGCVNAAQPNKKARANWEFQGALNKAFAQRTALAKCRARFGRRAPLLSKCLPVKLTAAESARAHAFDNDGPTEAPAYRYDRNEAIRRGSAALDEVVRRNREDEINRVLKEARECRMYGVCPGQR
ncbi:MAG: hypothetical protein EOP11_26130 [Proteobacteria bacterium]|nr:MAG: hypothetical protein EOP11_26130 [Pseudomonadota bacterium]